jgi:hypothetical protein
LRHEEEDGKSRTHVEDVGMEMLVKRWLKMQ